MEMIMTKQTIQYYKYCNVLNYYVQLSFLEVEHN